MIESPARLREICQKPNYRQVGNWMARHITRDMAIYLTWLVLHTPLRADSIALISLVCGFLAAYLVSVPTVACLLAGALMLQFWYLLDHVDGQVARYHKEADLTGTFFDFMIHFFVHSSMVFGLGLRMFHQTGQGAWLIGGFFAALAMGGLSQFNDCKYKAFFARLAQWTGKTVRMGQPAKAMKDITPSAQLSAPKRLFMLLYKLTEIHIFMNLLTLAALLQIAGVPASKAFIVFYVVLLPAVLAARMAYTIKKHRIDEEFVSLFREEE